MHSSLPVTPENCSSKRATVVGGVGVLVNTSLPMSINSFEQLATRIGRLRLKRCGSILASRILVVYASTSSYEDEEAKAFYMDLEKFYGEDHAFCAVLITIEDFNSKIGHKKRLGNVTLEPTGSQETNRVSGCLSLSRRPR
ncbi:unnamed protein product [Angiostrongylus costaricensis]|uniref:Uncharacterized protein n=1 Tax=Angiostrongylus costaricensis TaxID=334426 RepID=A0A0R3PNI4_ANGCS|nr:unnamed protein product [Angiostrongylus costaricensis]